MFSYYRSFIEKFSMLVGPLHNLTKTNIEFRWMAKEREAFETLKQKLTSQPMSILLDLSKPFDVHCETCGSFLGICLLQEEH